MSSNVGINNTPSVNNWHGKPGDASAPQQSSAGNGASGLIAGLPSRPYSARNASACSCCVASAYAVSVRGDCRPPPTPTDKTSDPKVLRHPFRDRGLPLPQRRQARQNNRPRCRPGRRHWPRAPNSGGGPLCMPLCLWAAQSAVAASELCVETRRSLFSPYLPPHTAATAIQHVYRSYIDKVDKEWEWRLKLSSARYALERDMNRAMRDLRDSNTFVYSVCDSYWIPRWDGG